MDIYDVVDLCKKGVSILKRYIVLLLIFVLAGSVLGYLKAKHDASETYTSSALLFVDLDREQYSSSNDIYDASTLSMLAKSFSQIVNSDSIIWGFTQTHLNGTGCMDLGDVLVMPVTGTRTRAWDAYRSRFSKKQEAATPGYYTVCLLYTSPSPRD